MVLVPANTGQRKPIGIIYLVSSVIFERSMPILYHIYSFLNYEKCFDFQKSSPPCSPKEPLSFLPLHLKLLFSLGIYFFVHVKVDCCRLNIWVSYSHYDVAN